VGATLDEVGYEPRVEGARLVLENCPFDRVAREHTALVCGLNLDFVCGVVDGLGCGGLTAGLEPSPGRCCVSVRDDATGS
jgi:predicted ArsR family transcriptional regulator